MTTTNKWSATVEEFFDRRPGRPNMARFQMFGNYWYISDEAKFLLTVPINEDGTVDSSAVTIPDVSDQFKETAARLLLLAENGPT